ncbi:MAG: GTP pyrophosphokinase [Vallitaleaceae bacterium]|nr:GTP pyrophosphokinase [Vallitaleaceae bacterium]
MSTLDKAILIAAQAHAGQKDRSGKPYILHPIRLMMNVDSDEEKVVAILHDVVEDSDWTLDGLREEGFSDEIITAVDCITKRDNEPYMNYIERLISNNIARRVKLADLEDNMDLRRIDQIANHDVERFKRNHLAWKKLMAHELKFQIANKIQ